MRRLHQLAVGIALLCAGAAAMSLWLVLVPSWTRAGVYEHLRAPPVAPLPPAAVPPSEGSGPRVERSADATPVAPPPARHALSGAATTTDAQSEAARDVTTARSTTATTTPTWRPLPEASAPCPGERPAYGHVDAVTHAEVLATVKRGIVGIDRCARAARAPGLVRMTWCVLPDGRTSHVTPADEDSRAHPASRCVAGAIEGWHFPAHQHTAGRIQFPFRLRP